MNKSKWSTETTVKFLETYELYPCLWNVCCPAYKNKTERQEAYDAIAREMQIPGFDQAQVKAKIRILRNAYALELKKIARYRRSGKRGKSILSWFPVADRILRDVVQTRETQIQEMVHLDCELGTSDEAEQTPLVDFLAGNPQSTSGTWKNSSVAMENNATALTRQQDGVEVVSQSLEENEFDVFGKLVACQLKKLSEETALEAMAHIHSYLVQQRLKVKSD